MLSIQVTSSRLDSSGAADDWLGQKWLLPGLDICTSKSIHSSLTIFPESEIKSIWKPRFFIYINYLTKQNFRFEGKIYSSFFRLFTPWWINHIYIQFNWLRKCQWYNWHIPRVENWSKMALWLKKKTFSWSLIIVLFITCFS